MEYMLSPPAAACEQVFSSILPHINNQKHMRSARNRRTIDNLSSSIINPSLRMSIKSRCLAKARERRNTLIAKARDIKLSAGDVYVFASSDYDNFVQESVRDAYTYCNDECDEMSMNDISDEIEEELMNEKSEVIEAEFDNYLTMLPSRCVCPICFSDHLSLVGTVISCSCGLLYDTEIPEISLSIIHRAITTCFHNHESSGCIYKPCVSCFTLQSCTGMFFMCSMCETFDRIL